MTSQDARTRAAAPGGEPSGTAIAVDRLATHGLKELADYQDLSQEQSTTSSGRRI